VKLDFQKITNIINQEKQKIPKMLPRIKLKVTTKKSPSVAFENSGPLDMVGGIQLKIIIPVNTAS
jgi:hypothetical protein